MKPIVKWAGGKRQLLDRILPLIPQCDCYYEPFLGGGAVAFAIARPHAVLSDANPELVNVYQVVRDNHEELLERLHWHEKLNSSDHYYEVRAWDRQQDYASLPALDRAARFLYLNKTCFNGLHRVNAKGQNNVPYGKYKNPDITAEPQIRELHGYLSSSNVDIRLSDFAEAVSDATPADFVYFDPPYIPLASTSFVSYTSSGFGMDQQERLAEICREFNRRGVPFVQSNSYAPAVRDLYCGFRMLIVQASRAINSKGSGRGKVPEVLILGDSVALPAEMQECLAVS